MNDNSLFDNEERSDFSPRRNAESSFTFLNRAAAQKWVRVRAVLESYFMDYPRGEPAKDLRARFRSEDPTQHVAAWWELYLYTLFSKLGYVLTPHPAIAGSGKRPDFLVSRGSHVFYLETAAVFPEIDDGLVSNAALDAQVFDIINDCLNPDFMVGVDFLRHGAQLPRKRDVVLPLEAWLNGLDADAVLASISEGRNYPRKDVIAGQWALDVTAFPLSRENRGTGHRLLGVPPGVGGVVTDDESLRIATRKKASRYGRPDAPLVLALLSTSSFTDDKIAESALIGSVGYQYYEGFPGNGKWVRLKDGVFMSERGPRATQLSAVLVGTDVFTWNHHKVSLRLWMNPWAARPLESTGGFPTGKSDLAGRVTLQDGSISFSGVFGIDEGWPEQ